MKRRTYKRARIAIAIVCAIFSSCVGLRNQSFRVVPQTPQYVLRAPDSRETPFPDILRTYNGFEPGRSWMDLRPLMALRIENAYYIEGASRRGLEGYLGTEVAHYEVAGRGLRLLSFQPLKERPANELPVQRLISIVQLRHRFYRFYFEIFFRGANAHGSGLLGADSNQELDRLSTDLARSGATCEQNSSNCTLFPEACSVSVEMQIVVNGKAKTVLWRTVLQDLFQSEPKHIEVKRFYRRRLIPVQIDWQDPNALKLPLVPGDHVDWN